MRHVCVTILGFCLLTGPLLVTASPSVTPKHLGTTEQRDRAAAWNRSQTTPIMPSSVRNWDPLRPFSEFEPTGFVAISGANNFELPELRAAIAKNLPADVTLIIFVESTNEAVRLKKIYSKMLGDDWLKFLVTPDAATGDPIWARDSLPFPVYLKPKAGSPTPTVGLVDSLYPQAFEPDAKIAGALGLPMTSTHQYFRGGNLLTDLNGNCFLENVNETAELKDPEGYLKEYFGCSTVTLLDQEGGIGDIDERIKFLGGNEVLTDNDRYEKVLANRGYLVHRIPGTGFDNQTYMNTLLVNGTMFIPQMGIAKDADAIQAYAALGFKTVGVLTKDMAVQGDGNIHCVTMNYPVGTFTASLRGGDFVEFAN